MVPLTLNADCKHSSRQKDTTVFSGVDECLRVTQSIQHSRSPKSYPEIKSAQGHWKGVRSPAKSENRHSLLGGFCWHVHFSLEQFSWLRFHSQALLDLWMKQKDPVHQSSNPPAHSDLRTWSCEMVSSFCHRMGSLLSAVACCNSSRGDLHTKLSHQACSQPVWSSTTHLHWVW